MTRRARNWISEAKIFVVVVVAVGVSQSLHNQNAKFPLPCCWCCCCWTQAHTHTHTEANPPRGYSKMSNADKVSNSDRIVRYERGPPIGDTMMADGGVCRCQKSGFGLCAACADVLRITYPRGNRERMTVDVRFARWCVSLSCTPLTVAVALFSLFTFPPICTGIATTTSTTLPRPPSPLLHIHGHCSLFLLHLPFLELQCCHLGDPNKRDQDLDVLIMMMMTRC